LQLPGLDGVGIWPVGFTGRPFLHWNEGMLQTAFPTTRPIRVDDDGKHSNDGATPDAERGPAKHLDCRTMIDLRWGNQDNAGHHHCAAHGEGYS